MATYNISTSQGTEFVPEDISGSQSTSFVITNNGPGASYFVLETVPPYSLSTPKNTSGSFTLGSGLSGLQQNDYFAGVVVAPFTSSTLTFVPTVYITGSSLTIKGNIATPLNNFGNLTRAFISRTKYFSASIENPEAVDNFLTSSLFSNASFLYIPSAYSASLAYAVTPYRGVGDLSFIRASSGSRSSSLDIIENVGPGIPRLDYTYGSSPALLLEPQRTNSIRNSTMQGASTSPSTLPTNWSLVGNGLSSTVVGVGTENGLRYIDVQLSGTATFNAGVLFFESGTQIVASNGQTWTNSFWAKIISTTLPPTAYRLNITERTSAGSYISETNTTFTPSSTLTRFPQTVTLAGGATVARVQSGFAWGMTSGQSYNFTIRIAAPQLELGAYATTWINTTNAAATRVGDYFRRSNIRTNGLISASGGTWYVELRGNVSLTAESATSGFWLGTNLFTDNSNGTLYFRQGGGIQRTGIWKYEGGSGSVMYATTTDTVKLAIKWNGTTADIFANGTKVVTATSFTATNMEFLAIASTGIGRTFFIQAMALYPTPLSNIDSGVLTGANYYTSYAGMAQALNYTIS